MSMVESCQGTEHDVIQMWYNIEKKKVRDTHSRHTLITWGTHNTQPCFWGQSLFPVHGFTEERPLVLEGPGAAAKGEREEGGERKTDGGKGHLVVVLGEPHAPSGPICQSCTCWWSGIGGIRARVNRVRAEGASPNDTVEPDPI